MKRNIISIIFSSMFLLFLIAPTVILIIDNSADVSCFYISSEEGEDKGLEKNKDKELIVHDVLNTASLSDSKKIENHSAYFFKNYPKPHLNLRSPPPDFYIFVI